MTESGAQVRAESRAQVREPDRAQGRDLVGQISRGYVPRRGDCVPKWDAVSAFKYALELHRTRPRKQQWCRQHLSDFWQRGEWPGYSSDLNQIENLWAIVQQEVDKMTPATSAGELAEQLKKAWGRIKPDVLENLVAGMPQCMHDCIAMKGGYIGK